MHLKLEFLTTKKETNTMTQNISGKKTMGRLSTKLNGGKIRLFSNCFSRVITNSSHAFTNFSNYESTK